MENLLLISEVAQELGQHSNAARIKKLIFATWKNRWENDLGIIDRFPLTNILQELVNSNPSPEELRVAFFNIVNTLNKKEEYTGVAEIILVQMDSLYLDQEPKTEMVYRVVTPSQSLPIYPNPVSSPSSPNSALDTITNVKVTVDSNLEPDSTPNSSPSLNLCSSGYDPFVIRFAIMKYSNPLRAKILLLCVLEEQSSFNQGSWLKLRAMNLDELLIDVFQKFPSLEQLESQLHTTANMLQEPDENAQAAEAIVKAMKPFYAGMVLEK
jgi:hypothetical protein